MPLRLCCFSTHYVDPDITRDHVLEVIEWSFQVLCLVLRFIAVALSFTYFS